MESYFLMNILTNTDAIFMSGTDYMRWCEDFKEVLDKNFPDNLKYFSFKEHQLYIFMKLSNTFDRTHDINVYITTEEDTVKELKNNYEMQTLLRKHLQTIINSINDSLVKERVTKIPQEETFYVNNKFYVDATILQNLGSIDFIIVKLYDIETIDFKYLDI